MGKTVVVLRFPFERNGFVDPKQIDWNQDKQHKLWSYVVQLKNNGNTLDSIDWRYLSSSLRVDIPFLQKQVYFLYEKELNFLKTELNRGTVSNSSDHPTKIDKLLKSNALSAKISSAITGLGLEEVEPLYSEDTPTSFAESIDSENKDNHMNIAALRQSTVTGSSVEAPDSASFSNGSIPQTPNGIREDSTTDNSNIVNPNKQINNIDSVITTRSSSRQTKNTSNLRSLRYRPYDPTAITTIKLKPISRTSNIHILTKPIPTASLQNIMSKKSSTSSLKFLTGGKTTISPAEMARRRSSVVGMTLPSYIKDQIRAASEEVNHKDVIISPKLQGAESPFPRSENEDDVDDDSLDNVGINSQSLYQSHFQNFSKDEEYYGNDNFDDTGSQEDSKDDLLFQAISPSLGETSSNGTRPSKAPGSSVPPTNQVSARELAKNRGLLKQKSFKTFPRNQSGPTSAINNTSEASSLNKNDVSSISDLSQTSISKSALEKVLMDNIYN